MCCAWGGGVLSICGVVTPVLLLYAVCLFSRCSLLAHLYLWFDGLLSGSGVVPPLKVWCAKLLLSSCRVRVLLSTCGIWVGSYLVAVCGLLSSLVGDSTGVAKGALVFPLR